MVMPKARPTSWCTTPVVEAMIIPPKTAMKENHPKTIICFGMGPEYDDFVSMTLKTINTTAHDKATMIMMSPTAMLANAAASMGFIEMFTS